MSGNIVIWIMVVAAMALQQQGADPPGTSPSVATPGTPDPQASPEHATADDLLRELQRRRPANEVIPPASSAGGEFPRAEPKLWPDGWTVVDVAGRLARGGAWWTFVGDSARFSRPVKLLPNASLEVMVRTATHAPSEVPFIVAGEMTVYHGENYLLVRAVRRSRAAMEAAKEPDAPSPDEPASPDAPVDDVLAVLKARKLANPLLDLTEGGSHDLSPGPFARAPGLLPDGSLIASRAGRAVRQDDWWVFVFESDHPDHRDTPIKLLPNLVTETMVTATEQEGVGVVFVVSGEVTQFEGENFLLPRFATRRVEMGNLRP